MDPYEKQVEKKMVRRAKEISLLKKIEKNLNNPVAPKKPTEFMFAKEDMTSFTYPIGLGNTIIEKKSDGNCVHVIIDRKASEKVRIYSSQLNPWNPACFPEILPELLKQPSGYYHGEMLGLKPAGVSSFAKLDEFNAIQKRSKHNASNVTRQLLEKYPLKIDIFDVLRYERTPLLRTPLSGRREILEDKIRQSSNLSLILQWNITSAKKLQDKFMWAIENGYEGLIAKDPASLYVPGSDDNDWIKLKEFTTLDLVVLGLYETPESRKAGKHFSALLVGTYNTETRKYETLGKVKVGAKADQEKIYGKLPKLIDTGDDFESAVSANRQIVINPAMAKIDRKIPSKIVKYPASGKVVIAEIKILDVTYAENWHSCGLSDDGKAHSLRIATYKQLRSDKNKNQDITSTQEIKDIYNTSAMDTA